MRAEIVKIGPHQWPLASHHGTQKIITDCGRPNENEDKKRQRTESEKQETNQGNDTGLHARHWAAIDDGIQAMAEVFVDQPVDVPSRLRPGRGRRRAASGDR